MLNVEWKSVAKHRGCKIAGIDLQFSSILTQGFQGYSTMNEWVDRWVGVWVDGWMTGWTDGRTHSHSVKSWGINYMLSFIHKMFYI